MSETFGSYLRKRREHLRESSAGYSLRGVATMLDIQPSYISKIERGEVSPPSEATIMHLAQVLKEDPDVLLALAGKVSTDLRQVILKRPKIFAALIRQLKDAPDHIISRMVSEACDAKWQSPAP